MGAAYVHVYLGLLRATTEEAQLREDGDAGELLIQDAEPALHRAVAVSGLEGLMVGGRRGEVPGVEVGRSVGRAKGCVPSVRQCIVQLCLLRDRAERLHCWGLQVEVAAGGGGKLKRVLGVLSAHAEPVLKQLQGQLGLLWPARNRRVAESGG